MSDLSHKVKIAILQITQFKIVTENVQIRPNLTSLTPLFKGSDVPTKVPRYQGRTFTGVHEQFWPNAISAATNDSYGYHCESNPDLLGPSPPP